MQRVSDIMHQGIERIASGASIQEAAHKMRELDVGFLCLSDGDTIQGCVTDRDLVIGALADNKPAHDTKISDIATRNVLAIEEDASVKDAIKMMKEHKVQRLIVKDESGGPAGTLSLADLVDHVDDGALVLELLKDMKTAH